MSVVAEFAVDLLEEASEDGLFGVVGLALAEFGEEVRLLVGAAKGLAAEVAEGAEGGGGLVGASELAESQRLIEGHLGLAETRGGIGGGDEVGDAGLQHGAGLVGLALGLDGLGQPVLRHAAADLAVGASDAQLDGILQGGLEVLARGRGLAGVEAPPATSEMGGDIGVVDDDLVALPDVEAAAGEAGEGVVEALQAVEEDDFAEEDIVALRDDLLPAFEEGEPFGGGRLPLFGELVVFADEDGVVGRDLHGLEVHGDRLV